MSSLLRTRLWIVAIASGILMAGAMLSAQAQEKKGDEETYEKSDRFEAAMKLLALGRQTSSPEAILGAAVILHANPLTEGKEKLEGAEVVPINPKELLKEAKALRPKDKALADYIAKLTDDFSEKSRGSLNFRGTQGVLRPGQPATFTIVYAANQPAMFRAYPTRPIYVTKTRTVSNGLGGTRQVPYQEPVWPTLQVVLTDSTGRPQQSGFVPTTTGPCVLRITSNASTPVYFAVNSN